MAQAPVRQRKVKHSSKVPQPKLVALALRQIE
jgi:hypothetical protein